LFPPEQVHINLGLTEDEMRINWVTQLSDKGTSSVQIGESPDALNLTVAADARSFKVDALRPKWYTHLAAVTGLKVNTTYFYTVGDSHNGRTEVFSFVHRRQPVSGEPHRHILFGDMGARCAFTLCDSCKQWDRVCNAKTCAGKKAGLVSEVDTAGMFLHTGDFAYNLETLFGTTGDHFFKNIQQLAVSVPYMVSHGNHEDDDKNLAHYIERFRGQPANSVPALFKTINEENGVGPNTMYFSWDYGLVHYVSISTELWFGVSSPETNVTKDSQLAWLRQDLAAANRKRNQVPWIVVNGHRSVYCSCDGDCDGAAETVRKDLEPMLMEFGVDFFINGHEHNYERSYPMYQNKSSRSNYNPTAPIYVVTGAAGSSEMHEPFTLAQPAWSAFRSNSFCYTRMLVYNRTHIHWQQVQTDPTQFPGSDYGKVIDDAWIVQNNHGPFSIENAPKEEGECVPGSCDSHDHWLPLLGIELNGRTGDQAIRDFRREQGEAAWVAKLDGLMQWLNTTLGRSVGNVAVWEDVRGDGSSDGATFKWKGSRA